jgi:ABC-2 type transport system ATP-binding protein
MTSSDLVIQAKGLRKQYGKHVALQDFDLSLPRGRILGVVGPNGAGKTTALRSMLGLMPFEGELSVLGLNPWTQRDALMRDVSFIADVAVLPRWLKVRDALAFMEGTHPNFSRARAEQFLKPTNIQLKSKVADLSKGMVTQLHLALVMAIDAQLMVLDEPTIGLDIIYRKQFYDTLLNDYFDDGRTIVITTHHPDEIQHVMTDVLFVNQGRKILECSMDTYAERFIEIDVARGDLNLIKAITGQALIAEQASFDRVRLTLDLDKAASRDSLIDQLSDKGALRAPSVSDLFIGLLGGLYEENNRGQLRAEAA